MDEFRLEQAKAVEEALVQRALDQRVRYVGVSAQWCEECGEPIPLARRESIKGCRLCVDCQAIADKRKAGVRRV